MSSDSAKKLVAFVLERVRPVYKHIPDAKFEKAFNTEDNLEAIESFFGNSDSRLLCIHSDKVVASLNLPDKLNGKNKGVYFLKPKSGVITEKTLNTVLYGEMMADPLKNLETVLQEVYVPLLANPRNHSGWGEVVSKEVMDKLYGLLANVTITLGQTTGHTTLPMPPLDPSASSTSNKERIYLLESAVITWSKQIRQVLKEDPEVLLKQGHPTPDVEIAFWINKAQNLNSIFKQLQSDKLRKVLVFLDQSKSTYCSPFAKLCKDVFSARIEANDNVKYLSTLQSWFDKLTGALPFNELHQVFGPIMHTILLIWKHSQHYNTAPRLVVLMREICNAIIDQALSFISGKQIFEMIEGEETAQAVEMLSTTLKVVNAFKSTYFDYKAKSNVECADKPWRIQNNALFLRLDQFLERCHDIKDFCSTIMQFSKLQRIEIGGTKGKTLTSSAQQIHAGFQRAVDTFKEVQYDIMDVSAKTFDDDFYEFRLKIKELERRLGSVITQAFDDSATIYAQFNLLDSFEGLLDRPIINDELEKKHSVLIRAYAKDLAHVGDIFLQERAVFDKQASSDASGDEGADAATGAAGAGSESADGPATAPALARANVVAKNMPPIAGALAWCHSLQDRIKEPMEKLLKLSNNILDKDEGKEVVKTYKGTMAKLQEFEAERVKMLGQDVQGSILNKLKAKLLVRDPETRLLTVNFDPSLVRLLREVKYFLLAGLSVPDAALTIYKKVETFRQYIGNLDVIVANYNRILSTMLPVEAPLIKNQIVVIDKALTMGIEVMNWKSHSHGIENFLPEALSKVNAANKVLDILKDNVNAIREMTEQWGREPLLRRSAKPVLMDDFQAELAPLLAARYEEIEKGGEEMHNLINKINRVLKVSKGLPDWRTFVDYVNEIVVDGLVRLVSISLDWFCDVLDPEKIASNENPPMIEININLVGSGISFAPDIYSTSFKTGVRDVVNSWIDKIVNVGRRFKRLDRPGKSTYAKDILENMEVVMKMARIQQHLTFWEKKCEDYQVTFEKYKYLWTTNLTDMMEEFTQRAYTSADGVNIPVLDLFDEQLTRFEEERQTVDSLAPFVDIGWLRVNAYKLKTALNLSITKWTLNFVTNLSDHVVSTLQGLEEFMEHVKGGMDGDVEPGDSERLKSVMTYIRDVRKRIPSTQRMWDPLKNCLVLLKKHKYPVESLKVNSETLVSDYLEQAPIYWDSIVNLTFVKKEQIFPLQNAASDDVKENIEQFYERLKAFRADFKKSAPFNYQGNATTAYSILDRFDAGLVELQSELEEMSALEDLFELPKSKYHQIASTQKELRLLKKIWDFKEYVVLTFDSWNGLLWSDVDTDDLEMQTNAIEKRVKSVANSNKVATGWKAFTDIKNTVSNMTTVLPLINELHSPALRERHWKAVAKVCKVEKLDHSSPTFALKDLLALGLHNFADAIQDVVEVANKELKIEQKLKNIEAVWATLNLEFVDFKEKPFKIVKVPDDVMENLEAHSAELQTIVGMGKFVDYFRTRVTKWEQDLGTVEVVLKNWVAVTKQWSSLEAIFLQSDDIRRELPEITALFEGVDKEFVEVCNVSTGIPNVIDACTREGFEETLRGNFVPKLETCQKSLNEYLDMKKKIFPRFYFVSNVALLEILSNGNLPKKIMPHVGDCFTNLKMLDFLDEPGKRVGGMISQEGERVDFEKEFQITGQVEYWLNDLQEAMRSALRTVLATAISTSAMWEVAEARKRHDWQYDYPAQAVLTGTQIAWTDETEAALGDAEAGNEDAVKNYEAKCTSRLMDLIALVRGKLTKAQRTKIIALITMDVHARDIVHKLALERATSVECFLWKQQMRFYYTPDTRDVEIKITDYATMYSYEYIGNTGRLVITPLTDRCYITLTMALRLMLGGAPAGPAGTGKTETTKDLARALALPIYVFNCSDQMNYLTLADIFKGLAQSGAWGCFDEFNRIPIEVLSVVATQVKQVLDAVVRLAVPSARPKEYQHLPAGQPPTCVGKFLLMEDEIRLIPTTGFFITMNPGYAGRTELPENLKVLFRSCAMIRPDLAPICENMLMAEGFVDARPLSVKFVTLYELSSDLLSPQIHYDWGLRSVKSVLRVAGALKRASPDQNEEPVLMRALRDFNTPKQPNSDMPIFLRLIQDLFPLSYKEKPTKDQDLIRISSRVAKEHGLQADEGFILKVVEFQELLDVRHSVMLLGCTGSAKSMIWRTLLDSWNAGFRQPELKAPAKPVAIARVINPKSLTSNELYGYMTLAKEWKDGVISIIMRGMSKCYKELGYFESQQQKWCVLDGDVDAIWIESMNTVMDDNKVLTLVSNERVALDDAMRMVFEINSLDNATPATVSRAGILYVNEDDVGWQPFLDSWIASLDDDHQKANLPNITTQYFEQLIRVVCKGLEDIVPIRVINKISTTCYILEALINKVEGGVSTELLENMFAWSAVWAFGGTLTAEHQKVFSERFTDTFPKIKMSKDKANADATVFDFKLVLPEGEGACASVVEPDYAMWSDFVDEYVPKALGDDLDSESFTALFIDNMSSSRTCAIVDLLAKQSKPVLLVGSAGTGKTRVLHHYVDQQLAAHESYIKNTINMNYFMDARIMQAQVEQVLDKRSGSTFGPPGGKHCLCLVDDLNLPYIEEYGTQNSLELLRQLIDQRGAFDREDPGFYKTIQDVQYLAAMNPTAGSFTVNERVQRHFATLNYAMPDSANLKMVYGSILRGHLELGGFEPELMSQVDNLVNASIFLYQNVAQKFMPSAIKFVYNWNMRELSNIFRGMTKACASEYKTPGSLLRLWLHESYRVFGDRLITESDRSRFDDLISDAAKKHFTVGESDLANTIENPLLFTQFHTDSREYVSVTDYHKLKQTVADRLEEYNESNAVMNLELFHEALEHVTRVVRIIQSPEGSGMLVGVGGSGKQSLTKLAAYICDYTVQTIPVTSTYTYNDFKENLKIWYTMAGVKNMQFVLLIADRQIVDEQFLVCINDILSSGWIPGLFQKDEIDAIYQSNRKDAKAEGIMDTPEDNHAFFVNRVRRNLHIVMAFSPFGEAFRRRARRFPAIINCTVIDWFHPWSRDALVAVGNRFLADVPVEQDLKENISHHMAEVHQSVLATAETFFKTSRRRVYTTPKSFLELIAFFKNLLAEKRESLKGQVDRLGTGLQTLINTAKDVAELQEDLKVTMVKVAEKQKSTDELLETMGVQKAKTAVEQEKAQVEQNAADEAAAAASEIKASAEKELGAAKPMLLAAQEAVDCLDKASLTELKSLSSPPAGVDLVTNCCLMMLENEYKNHTWARAKKMMAKVDHFLQRLKDFDHETMEEKLVDKLTPIVDDPNMEYDTMFKKSQAAANLSTWIQNIYKCNRIFVRVKPLMEKLANAEAAQAAAEKKLAAVTKLVQQVEAALAKLEETFIQATNEKAKVVAQAKACEERLDLAHRLIGGLSSERARWSVEVDALKVQETNITGDVLLASAFVSYAGAFDAANRENLWKNTWMQDLVNRDIATSEGVDPLKLLSTDAQVAKMVAEGIPADRISLENGAMVNNAKRWPLLIDPQLQAMNWLRVKFEDPKYRLQIIQMNNPKWMPILSNAISEGTVVFIENLTEEIDASIEPVLAREVYKKGYGRYLNLGGEAIEYDDNFQLFMQTRLFNPEYLPEIQAQVTMINFIATEGGLEDQLLAKVVAHEAPELELRKQELQRKFNQYKIQLINLEDELLERLANAPDDILSDVPLIEGLEATKATAEEVNKAVELGKATEVEINKSRELYRPAAAEGAMLYFIVTALEVVDHMYQYSLGAFEYFFAKAMDTAEMPEGELSDPVVLQKRVGCLRFSLRLTIYTWVCRGLFEKHKLILLCQILFQLMRRGKMTDMEFQPAELDFLIRGPKKVVDDSPVEWLPNSAWFAVSALSDFPEFAKLTQDIQDAPSRFKEWFNHVSPETEKLPLDWAALDKNFFKKLLVLRCLRPDRMTVALASFLRDTLPKGKLFVDCDLTFNSFQILQDVYKDSGRDTPIYFILSPGTDVVADLDMLAQQEGFVRGETYHNVSMGQGQDVVAERLMNIAAKDGHWVILNNVHLMPRWLKKVEKMLDDFATDENTNTNFRVFLTSEPSKGIPIGILNRCIKLTNEPPAGLKANLKRAFCSFNQETFNDWDSKTRSIIFGLCHFHSLMLERKKFGPMGFNMMYPFSLGDLRDSAVCLNNYMENVESRIPWQDLRYIFGEIMYGGHIVNDFDRLLCNSYLDFIMDDGLLEEMEFFPFVDGEAVSFKCPAASTYARYLEHIEDELKEETPIAYGLHPNAQIDFRTQQSIEFFNRLIDLTPKDSGAGSGDDTGQSPRHIAENALNDILERLNADESQFNLADIREMIGEELNPYQNVFLQEMQQMNRLVSCILDSLHDLNLGFAGELTMSDAMEELMECLFLDKVPSTWTKLAWPSRRSLAPWLDDLQKRIQQLREWEGDVMGIPTVTWLAGLLNPQSFLTAIMQQAAQKNGWELDKLFIQTEVLKKHREQVDNPSRDGAFIDGLNLEGARWNISNGSLEKSRPREMFFQMPVIFCKSNFTSNMPNAGVYMCPVYKTRQRGPTYVALAQLKSKAKSAQWVMAGVALIMDVSE